MSKKFKKLNKHLKEFIGEVKMVYLEFSKFINSFIDGKIIEVSINELEKKADIRRRKIIKILNEEDFLSDIRIEFMQIIEKIDKIADKAEKVYDDILIDEFEKDLDVNIIRNILMFTDKSFDKMEKSLFLLFDDYQQAFEIAHSIEIDEENVDVLKKQFIDQIKKFDMEFSKKIYYRDFINNLSDISDIIEDIGDEIEKITAKRI